MVYKDEVCMWFKDNESHRRLELLCGLLNMCLPFELRFIRTCVEDLGKRDDLLRDFDSKANSSLEISQLGKVLDERTRSKFVVYVALLEANNQTCSKILFETLSNAQEIPNSALSNNLTDNINYIKEMLLIYTMVLHHPAFTFEEKRVIGERFQSLQVLEEEITKKKKSWNHQKASLGLEVDNQDLSIESCHPISSPQGFEQACDSGLSIGTEPEVEVLSDHVCVPAGVQLPHGSCNSSNDSTFEDMNVSKESMTTGRPMLNPSIGTRNSEKLPCSSNLISSSASSVIPLGPSAESRQPCPPNRDASSSGSGESLDLYGESISVPTTYIYNSNIYDHQNLNEMPAVALSSNMINLTAGYMYQHNGRCHFYHYPPLMGGVLPSVPLPRKLLPPGLSSETSSSEEGGGTSLANTKQRSTLNSPLSSSQSSPYASPPQSLTPSRASSPKDNTVTTFAPSGVSSVSSHVSHGLVTGTTTTIVISKSSPKPPIRHSSSSSSSGSGSNSHPSSPALTNSNQISRNKPPVISKSQKYVNDRPNNRNRSSPNNCQIEGPSLVSHGSALLHSCKENGSTNSYSSSSKEGFISAVAVSPNKTQVKSSGRSLEGSYNKPNISSSCISLSSVEQETQIVKTVVSNTLPNTTVVPSSNSLKSSCSVVPSSTSLVSLTSIQTGCHNGPDVAPVKANNIKNLKEEKHLKDNSLAEIKTVAEETEKLKPKQNGEEKDFPFVSLPNGFSEYLLISSAHSVPLKHSTVQTSSVPSCSCTHVSGANVSLQSDSCKMSLSNATHTSKQKLIPSVSQCVGSDNLVVKSNQNKPILISETMPQNVLPSITTAITHTVPSKLQYNLLTPNADVPPNNSEKTPLVERVSSPITSPTTKPLQQITSISPATLVNSSSQTSTYTSSSLKYTSVVTTSNPIANSSQSLNKPSLGESGHQIHTSTPTGQVFAGSSVKTTAMGSSILTFTTTTSSTNTIVSLVPSPGTYPPYLSIPVLPGGASSYLPQGAFSHHTHGHPRTPSHAFFLASPPGMVQGPPGHLMKGGHPHIIPPPTSNMSNSKSRGSSSGRSGSSSSSSSSGLSRKKAFMRGAQYQSKSRSSDSSPSSSQYSSPPQTPSPDHTKDARTKPAGPTTTGKPGDGYSVEEVWEPHDSSGPCLPCTGSREEGTPPPHPVGPHIMIPSNPVRQRYIPYHQHLGFIGYPHPHSHHGVYRYSLTSPSVVMGPRPSTPLSSEKSSRETTPPNHSHATMGPLETSQKSMDYSNSTASSSASFNMCAHVSTPSMGPSSTSPPIPGPMAETSSVTLVPPPGPSGHSGPPNGMSSNMHQYNPSNYPMFAMGTGPFVAHLSGFMPSSSGLPNGYVSPHNLPPSFPVPSMTSGMNSGELVYPNPYPVMAQTTLATSSCGGHPILHQSSGGHTPVITPSPALPPYTPSYQNPPSSNPVPPPVKKPLTCYNCGKVGHRGSECKESSIDEMTKRTKVL